MTFPPPLTKPIFGQGMGTPTKLFKNPSTVHHITRLNVNQNHIFIKTITCLLSYLAKNHNDYKIHQWARDRHNSGSILLKVWVFVQRVNYQQLVYNHSHHEQHDKRYLTNKITCCYCKLLLSFIFRPDKNDAQFSLRLREV